LFVIANEEGKDFNGTQKVAKHSEIFNRGDKEQPAEKETSNLIKLKTDLEIKQTISWRKNKRQEEKGLVDAT